MKDQDIRKTPYFSIVMAVLIIMFKQNSIYIKRRKKYLSEAFFNFIINMILKVLLINDMVEKMKFIKTRSNIIKIKH